MLLRTSKLLTRVPYSSNLLDYPIILNEGSDYKVRLDSVSDNDTQVSTEVGLYTINV